MEIIGMLCAALMARSTRCSAMSSRKTNHGRTGEITSIEGHHTQVNEISVSLRKRLLENGMPNEELQALLKPEKEVNAT